MPGTGPWTGLGLALLLAALLLQTALPQLGSLFYPDGDFAADLLLVNALDSQGYLLTGHYSRFGFNHPGPVFFYLNALFEQLGGLFGLPRANAWILCTLVTNLAFLLLIAGLLPRLFERTFSPLSLAAVLPILLVLGADFFTTWMPYRLLLPFAAFYLALLLLLEEGPRLLPLAVLLACILIHGYVTLPLFTLPFLLLALFLIRGKLLEHANRRWIGLSLLIALGFSLPLVLDLLLNEPSNLERIIAAGLKLPGEIASLRESSLYALSYWEKALPLLIPGALLFLFGQARRPAGQPVIRNAALLAGLFSLVFVLYHSRVPKPLLAFMGLYYLAVPTLLASLLLYAGLLSLGATWRHGLALVISASLLLWVARLEVPPPPKRDYIQRIGDFLIQMPGNRIALDYPVHSQELWGLVEGLLVYLKDRGVDACVARSELDFMYTANAICTTPEIDLILDHGSNCAGDCLYTWDLYAVRRPPLSEVGARLEFPACQLPRLAATGVDKDCAVSTETPGIVTFGPYIRLTPGRYRFDLEYAAPGGPQEQAGHWDVVTDKGQSRLSYGELPGTGGVRLTISGTLVIDRYSETEIRTWLEPGQRLSVHKMTLSRE